MPGHHSVSLQPNKAPALTMHIDLNSCFATVEQQARPGLRGRPLGVTNRATPNACVVAVSIEAKALGVKVGMGRRDAEALAPGIIILETDPPKYHYVYQRLVEIMGSYSPHVTMKSIDEGIIEFKGTIGTVNKRSLTDIGYEIKQRLKDDVGIWMKCNIGIAPNRFLAKQAAGLHKPDGMDVIDHTNLRQTLSNLKLTDLTGIAERNQARLNACGIYTPLQFLDASADLLRHQVFHSICGEDWYQRLRGYEVDDTPPSLRTIGRQYVLNSALDDESSVIPRLSYLCETTGLKLRYKGMCARGIMVYARYTSGDYWYERKMFKTSFFSNAEIYRRALLLFNRRPDYGRVQEIGVTCYALEPSNSSQLSLLDEINREVWLTQAIDKINEDFGEATIAYAPSLASKSIVKQKIPFGSTRYFELLLKRA